MVLPFVWLFVQLFPPRDCINVEFNPMERTIRDFYILDHLFFPTRHRVFGWKIAAVGRGCLAWSLLCTVLPHALCMFCFIHSCRVRG
jgi:hypothetical protein